MSQHSKGPWSRKTGVLLDANGQQVIFSVGVASSLGRGSREEHANTQLLVMAPELHAQRDMLLLQLQMSDAWIREALSRGVKIPCENTLRDNRLAIARAKAGAL